MRGSPLDPARDDIVAYMFHGTTTEYRVANDLPNHIHLTSTVTGARLNMPKTRWRQAVKEGRAWVVSRSGIPPLYQPQGRPPAS